MGASSSGNGWLGKLLEAVTPKEAATREGGDGTGADDYEAWYENADGATRAVCACVRGTVLDGRVIRAAYDAETDGYAARAFHAAVDGAGPCVVVGRTKAGSRFAGFNPLGFYGVEDYRSCASAFLARWESEKATREAKRQSLSPTRFRVGIRRYLTTGLKGRVSAWMVCGFLSVWRR